MAIRSRIAVFVGLTILASCDTPSAPVLSPEVSASFAGGVQNHVKGRYTANVAVPPGQIIASYVISGVSDRDGEGHGTFSFHADTPEGTIEFVAKIICLPVDNALGRAWVGATIQWNGSTRPTHQGAIHQAGEPIWFRIADRSGEPDRTTSLGFRGALGIQTSEAYCAARPWGNEGTAVLSGDVAIR